MTLLIKRNLLMFFRDRSNVFFSLLAVFIIIGLYALFLGDVMMSGFEEALGSSSDKIDAAVFGVTLSAVVAVAAVTVNLGALSVAVGDKQNAAKDFYTSPISRAKITGGYMLGSGLAGLIMTLTALILCVAFIAAKGGSLPDLPDCGLLLLTTVLSVLCGNSIVYFVSLFIRSVNAFAAVSTVIGTMIGFLMGVYVPIGALPDTVGWVIKCFPMSHAGSMFKLILADGDIAELFANAPPGALESFRQSMGVTFWYGDFESGFWFSAAVLVVTSAVFYGLSVAVSRKL